MTTRDTITQFFENVLFRSPTTAELAVREALVTNGSSTLEEICLSIANSVESQTYVHQLIRIYQTAFGRKPDAAGLDGWVDDIRDGTITSMEMIDGFVRSPEWAAKYGTSDVTGAVIQEFYQNMLGREASAQEVANWLATGDPVGEVLIGIANSAEAMTLSTASIVALQQAACNVSDPSTIYTGQGSLFDADPTDPDVENPGDGEPGDPDSGGPNNDLPTLTLDNTVTELPEDTNVRTKVADIVITDDGLGVNVLTLSGGDASLFEIDGSELFLIAGAALDFEGSNTELDITVIVDDATIGTTPDDMESLTISVTDVNEAPTFDSLKLVKVKENQAFAIDADVTDPEGDTEGAGITYSLTNENNGGLDNADFSVNPNTGEVTFNANADFDNPVDDNKDNLYLVQLTATDSGGASTVEDITVIVEDVNEAPTFTSPATANVDENQTSAIDANATDPEGDTEGAGLTYSFTTVNGGGVDNGLFSVDPNTGEVTFNAAPDFETPADDDKNNTYQVQLSVTDSGGLSTVQDISVTVADVFEPNFAPEISSDGGGDRATVDVVENLTDVTDVQTKDDSDSEGSGLTYSFSEIGGRSFDNDLFNLDTTTGEVTFKVAPDFENPGDANMDNTYQVQVTVTDSGGLTDTQTIDVNVGDGPEGADPVITSDGGGDTATITVDENQTAVTDVQSLDLVDSEGSGLTYQLTTAPVGFGEDNALFDIDANTGVVTFKNAPDFEMPADVKGDNSYRIAVEVKDQDSNTDVQSLTINVANVAEGENPEITSDGGGDTATVTIAENQKAVTDVQTIDNKDSEGSGLTYSFNGNLNDDSALFNIDSTTGEITFVSEPDFENPGDKGGDNDYELTVVVLDGDNNFDTQAITVTVTDVNEAPVIDGGDLVMVNSPENQTAVLDVDTTDPEGETESGGGLTYSFSSVGGRGDDNSLFAIGADGALTFKSAPDFENAGDMNGDNKYQVQVSATDSGGETDVQDIVVTVTDVVEAGPNTAPVLTVNGAGPNGTTFGITTGAATVTNVDAIDAQDGAETNLTYSLSGANGGLFDINANGILSFKVAPTQVTNTPHQVQVIVTDSGGLSDTENLLVNVIAPGGGGGRPLTAATGMGDAETDPLTQQEMMPLVDAAMTRWMDAGLSDGQKEILEGLNFFILDLHDDLLGLADSNTVIIDINAAGHGWFVDQTPLDDAEFSAGAVAPGGMDLLTTIMHEMGHSVGIEEHSTNPGDLMFAYLDEGERRAPNASDVALIGQDYLSLDA